ncbi:DUF1272 domain-containing protein [Psychrobacter sp. LV10R520-6]|uniref:DUF1272 domain-containing protein n=1 Tax=Psychrobacter sp. LV10R520-6 TaxID=1415574 RepID=UPI0024CDD715|nr:DUF1272 domain-containing protein [Psychrobacter sp. LV10R520-6]SNT70034.1 hypothetical protein SAMN04488491_1167 [Psychrobacter sp. LV10R520-6]
MVELRPNCERCDRDLPPDATDAMICSFECTFCTSCTTSVLNNHCPNCGGNLTSRPIRPASLLENYPPSTKRIVKKDS